MKKTARNIYLGFILFLMYSEIIFLYYFEDLQGALVTALSFCGVTFLASLIAVHLPAVFFGVGIWTGSVVGFTVAYMRLRWMETHIDEHMFCRGNLIKRGKGIKPSAKVFDIRELKKEPEDEE